MNVKNKKPLIFIVVILLLILLLPYLIYFIHFRNSLFSNYNNDWGNFGNFINGSIAPIITVIGLLISYVIYKVTTKQQEMAQRPLPYIKASDYENNIQLNLYNKGLGPLIITNYKIINIKTKKEYKGIFQAFEGIEGTVNNYTGNFDNLVLASGENLNLFEYSTQEAINAEFILMRDNITKRLSELKFEIRYKDIYENKIEPFYSKELSWYSRT